MSEISVAIIGLIVTVIGAIGTGLATLLPLYVQRQRLKLELETSDLRQRAADAAVQAVEERARGDGQLRGAAKVQAAIGIAESATPKSVTITPADVQASVTRLRASLPTQGSLPPLSIPVQLVSSEPPPGAADERTTNPLPPAARVPVEWTQAAGLQKPRKP